MSRARGRIAREALAVIRIVYSFFTPDFSDPLTVMKRTEELWRKNDFKTYLDSLVDAL